jgi:hypothetical protein
LNELCLPIRTSLGDILAAADNLRSEIIVVMRAIKAASTTAPTKKEQTR